MVLTFRDMIDQALEFFDETCWKLNKLASFIWHMPDVFMLLLLLRRGVCLPACLVCFCPANCSSRMFSWTSATFNSLCLSVFILTVFITWVPPTCNCIYLPLPHLFTCFTKILSGYAITVLQNACTYFSLATLKLMINRWQSL